MKGLLRQVTQHVPIRLPATLLNVVMSTFGLDGRPPDWRISDGPGTLPLMVLNVSSPFQRRMYWFPLAYWERLLHLPFGRFAARQLRAGDVFLDVGANVGFYTLFAAQRVGPEGRVHSFEPEPMTFESLRRSVGANRFSWATCHNLALSDRDGVLRFYYVADGSAHSLTAEIPARAHRYAGTTEVAASSLDALVASGTIDASRIDLVKMDVEGEEARTVRGMLGTLHAAGFPLVWAEVRGPRGSTRAPNTFPAVRDALQSLGYQPFLWTPRGVKPVSDGDISGREDVLFIHPSRPMREDYLPG